MTARCLVLAALAAGLPAQETGSIRGTVLDGQGKPIPGQRVMYNGGSRGRVSANARGEFSLDDLQPGRYRVFAYGEPGASAFLSISVAPGETVEGVRLRLDAPAAIRGRVLDDNGEPLPGIRVLLVGTEYRYGELRHTFRGSAETDDLGEYALERVVPGVRYAVMARAPEPGTHAISDVPAKPAARRPAFPSTYFPGSADLAGAERLVLRSGETREGIDIRMKRSPSYCASGLVRASGAPAAMSVRVEEVQPSSGSHSSGGFYIWPPGAKTAGEGRFRLCDLAPGEYRIMAWEPASLAIPHLGLVQFAVVDRDVDGLVVEAAPPRPLRGEIVWAGDAPAEPTDRRLFVRAVPTYRSFTNGEAMNTDFEVPGEFEIDGVYAGDYEVTVDGLADDWYVAALDFGGQNLPHGVLNPAAARPDSRLSIAIARDGGFIEAAVENDDGKPVVDAPVYVLPETAVSPGAAAAEMTEGRTDQRGVFRSRALRRGSYRVVALGSPAGVTPEGVARILQARQRAPAVDVEPGKTVRTDAKLRGR